MFYPDSKETFINSHDGYTKEVNLYRFKENKKNGNIGFNIKREIFIHNRNDTIFEINKKKFFKIKFSSLEDIHKKWKESELFSNQRVYDQIYIVRETSVPEKYEVIGVTWTSAIR